MLSSADGRLLHRMLEDETTISAQILELTIRVLDTDLLSLLSSQLNPTQSSVVSGLLSTRQLASLSDDDIDSTFIVQGLQSIDPRYAKLAFCCRSKWLYGGLYDPGDLKALSSAGIQICYFENFDRTRFREPHVNNIVQTWDLEDGGGERPSTIFAPFLAHANKVVIYDRYFKEAAAAALEELLTSCCRQGAGFDLEMYIGQGHTGWTPTTIHQRFANFFRAGGLKVFKSSRPPGQLHHTHDRYVQIDKRLTFELSSGLSCFFDDHGNNLHNRASSITLRNLCIGRSQISIQRIPGGALHTILK